MITSKLILFLQFLKLPIFQSNNPFVTYLTKFKTPGSLLDVYEDPINMQFKFGLPRLFIGSYIMKLQREIYFKYSEYQQFWQIAKTWIIISNDIKQVDSTYVNYFIPEARKYLCQNWTCCTNEADCNVPGNNPLNGKVMVEMLGDPNFEMPFRFLVLWCEIAWDIYYRNKKFNWDNNVIYRNIRIFCPSACQSNPCSTKQGVDNPNDCKATGLYVDQYECQCLPGSKWNENSLTCLSLNPCEQSTYSACDADGTDQCINSGDMGFVCICNENRMGFDCTQERNACLNNFNTNEKNGNYYCNVRFSNKCIPYLGTNYYRCECVNQFTSDMTIHFDNCLKSVDNCQFLVCLNGGICTTSPDQTESACLCKTNQNGNTMFTGFYCEIPLGVWSHWSKWTKCHPNCGESLYRIRKRYCLNETLQCEGFSEEIMPCLKKKNCPKLKLSGNKKTDIIDYPSLVIVTTFVLFQMIGSFFLAQFLILNREILFPYLVKYCCAPCQECYKEQL